MAFTPGIVLQPEHLAGTAILPELATAQAYSCVIAPRKWHDFFLHRTSGVFFSMFHPHSG
ncbi:hypothetical protein [Rhodopila globiformis]|uniref:hypothetical protein n=1 Tax=Rhodopila globiformis TaxID=1071 RepID=UPI0011B0D236|nr:hypothetical protein [Rhodopila globiformis]